MEKSLSMDAYTLSTPITPLPSTPHTLTPPPTYTSPYQLKCQYSTNCENWIYHKGHEKQVIKIENKSFRNCYFFRLCFFFLIFLISVSGARWIYSPLWIFRLQWWFTSLCIPARWCRGHIERGGQYHPQRCRCCNRDPLPVEDALWGRQMELIDYHQRWISRNGKLSNFNLFSSFSLYWDEQICLITHSTNLESASFSLFLVLFSLGVCVFRKIVIHILSFSLREEKCTNEFKNTGMWKDKCEWMKNKLNKWLDGWMNG